MISLYHHSRQYQPAAAINPARRRGSALLGLLALVGLTFGPATGLLHALHLAHAGDHHDHQHCSYCQHLLGTPKNLPDPPVELSGTLLPARGATAVTSAELTAQHTPRSLLPRGPPFTPEC